MFIPQGLDLLAVIGGTFDPTFTFYTDADQTDALDLTHYTALLQIADLLELTPGDGLTLGGIAGTLAVLLTDTQTAAIQASTVSWWLRLTNTSAPAGSGVGFPLRGNITFELP